MEITRHFTATTMIVYKNKTLLHFHKKLKTWLPVGGHIDRDELPEEAALREIKEEAGLDVEFYNPDALIDLRDAKQLLRPVGLILEDINPFHQHIDFVYFARSKTDQVNPMEGESMQLKWFTAKDIEATEMLDNVKKLAKEALKTLATIE